MISRCRHSENYRQSELLPSDKNPEAFHASGFFLPFGSGTAENRSFVLFLSGIVLGVGALKDVCLSSERGHLA